MTAHQSAAEIKLRNRIDELEEQVRQLAKIIGADADDAFIRKARDVFRVSPGQARLLKSLSMGVPRSSESLMAAYTAAGETFATDNCLKVQIYRLRASLAQHSINLHNIFGYGYVIDEPNQEALRAMMGDDV